MLKFLQPWEDAELSQKKHVMAADVTSRPRNGERTLKYNFSSILACVGAWLMNSKEPKSTILQTSSALVQEGK